MSTMPATATRHSTTAKLTEAQVDLFIKALEFFSRMGMNQFSYLMDLVRLDEIEVNVRPISAILRSPVRSHERLEAGDQLVDEFKIALLNKAHSGGRKGIRGEHTPASAQIGWGVLKVLRHRRAWDRNPQGGHGVYFDDPYLLWDSEQPKVTITKDRAASIQSYRIDGMSEAQLEVMTYALLRYTYI